MSQKKLPIYIVTYYIKLVTTSWTYSTVSVFSCVEKFATIEEKRRAKEKQDEDTLKFGSESEKK